MPTAAIKFIQGLTSSLPGQALIGVLSTPVTFENGDDTDVFDWTWELYYAPPGASVGSPGTLLSSGNVPNGSFTPDVAGGYTFDLTVKNKQGVQAKDRRVFQVAEASGYIIPPLGGNAASMNFAGQELGWTDYLGALLRHLLAGGGGGGSVGSSGDVQLSNGAGAFVAATVNDDGAGNIKRKGNTTAAGSISDGENFATFATTNSTVHNYVVPLLPPGDPAVLVYFVEATVTARDATNAHYASFVMRATISYDGAGNFAVSAGEPHIDAFGPDQGNVTVDFVAGVGVAYLQVHGIAATNLTWNARFQVTRNAP